MGEVINIGSNFEISIGEAANTIADVMGVQLEIQTDNQRFRPEASEVERLWASNMKALELLKWQPEFGGLDGFRRGITETVEWFANPENLQDYKADIYNI